MAATLVFTAGPSRAAFIGEHEFDGHRDTRVWWSGWSVSSSESLWGGSKYKQYPLTHLFDGDARTTWAYSGLRSDWKDYGWRGKYGISLRHSGAPIVIDGLWLMNGYNRSSKLFGRNDRITEVEIWCDGRRIKTARLSDRMGWHKVSFPWQQVEEVGLIFRGLEPGSGADRDVCISELALAQKGRRLDMKMPHSVMYDKGNQTNDVPEDLSLIARDGKIVSSGIRSSYEAWSTDGRFVCGAWRQRSSGDNVQHLVWVADSLTSRIIHRQSYRVGDGYDPLTIGWRYDSDKIIELVSGGTDEYNYDNRNRNHSTLVRHTITLK